MPSENMAIKFFDKINAGRDNPKQIFGSAMSLTYLANFINGYVLGRNRTNLGIEDDLMWFRAFHGGFNEFVSKKLQIEVSQPWNKMIEFACLSDPHRSIEVFYELLDEFLGNVGDATADDIPDPYGWKDIEITPIELIKTQPHFLGSLDIGRERPILLFGPTLSLAVLAQTIRGYVAGRDGTDLGIDEDLKRFIAPEDGFIYLLSSVIAVWAFWIVHVVLFAA